MQFSVVIPAFNSEKTIRKAVESVVGEGDLVREIIVVDDGSSDRTGEIASGVDDKVRVLQQSNLGSAAARQHGSDVAECNYLAYLDADDWWLDGKLSTVRKVLAAEDLHFMIGDLIRGKGGNSCSYSSQNSSFYPSKYRSELIHRRLAVGVDGVSKFSKEAGFSMIAAGVPVFPSTMVVSKSALNSVGGWDAQFRRCQDFDLGLRLAKRFDLFHMDSVFAVIGWHSANLDRTGYMEMQCEGDVEVLEHHLASIHYEEWQQAALSRLLVRRLTLLANLTWYRGDTVSAKRFFKRAILVRSGGPQLRSKSRAILDFVKNSLGLKVDV